MSTHSEIAINKFMFDNNIKAMMLQETGNWTPSAGAFAKTTVITNNVNLNSTLLGVSLVIDKSLDPEHIAELDDPEIDAVWCQIKLNNKRTV